MLKHKLVSCAMAALVALAVAQPAYPLALPYGEANKAQASFRFADKLYGYGWATVDADGNAVVHARYSNSRRKWFNGPYALSVVVKVMAGESVLKVITLSGEIRSVTRGTRILDIKKGFSLTPAQWASVTEIKYEWGQRMTDAECRLAHQLYEQEKLIIDPCAYNG